jgi:glycosyltransferase involved in cell wall biosynthesis
MRVAVFTDNDFDKVNGVTTALAALLAHAPCDVAPRIYTAATEPADTPTYLAFRSLPVPIPFYGEMSMYLPHCRRYLRRVLADEIEVLHLTTPGPMGLTALWIAARTGLPLVGSFHTDLEAYTTLLSGSSRLGRWMGAYMKWMYGHCQTILVPSTATRAMLVDHGTDRERIGLWTRGVDTALFTPRRRSESLRGLWNVADSCPALIYVGRLSREKGLEILPEVSLGLRRLGLSHRFIFVGDGPLRSWLQARCPAAVFTGNLGRAAVAEAFASADMFLFPSRTDTAGNVVLEAQAAGVPVLVSDQGGPCENMMPGITGLLVGSSDPREWLAATVRLLRDVGTRHALGVGARQYALTRSWHAALESVYSAYRYAQQTTRAMSVVPHHAI